jgi:hypothetical protein
VSSTTPLASGRVDVRPRAGGSRQVGIRGSTCRREQEPFDLGQEDLREHRDGWGSVGEQAPQSLRTTSAQMNAYSRRWAAVSRATNSSLVRGMDRRQVRV